MMKTIFAFITLLVTTFTALAQVTPKWARYPAISPDGTTIVFSYKGDLFSVASTGGEARQLTRHEAHDYMPVWSKDGSKIAFASDRYGNFDVFVMDALGGAVNRLTFHSTDENPYSFSHDDASVIFGAQRQDAATHRQYPTGSQPELYSVPANGGRVAQLFTIPAEAVQVSKDGSMMLYQDKKGGENEWRKHHRSAITRDIWKYDVASNTHTMITNYEGEDRYPVFSPDGESMFYLSEQENPENPEAKSPSNVYKKSLTSVGLGIQLTFLKTHPVRFLSIANNGLMSFSYDGELYTFKEGDSPKKVAVTIRSEYVSNPDEFITINGGVSEMAVSPDGKEIAFVVRGEVFVTSVDGSLTKRITNTPETERFVTFTPDGKGVVYAGERDGMWRIYKTTKVRESEPFFFASSLLKEEPFLKSDADVYLPQYSPDGKSIAYIYGRRTLRVQELSSGKTVDLLTPKDLFHMSDGDKYFTWSPDSKWLLIDWSKTLSNSEILLMSADGKTRKNLTESGYADSQPLWVNEGQQMIWFSNKNGLKSYATSGRTEDDVYSMFFSKAAWDKYNMSEEDYKLMKSLEEANKPEDKDDDDDDKKKKKGKKSKDDDKKEEKLLTFDWDGMTDRTARFTIHSSAMSDATLSKDGEKLYYLSRFEDRYNLWETELRTKETSLLIKLNTGGGSFTWDKKMENLYLLSGGGISKVDVKGKKTEPIKIAGEMTFDADNEREYMLEHVYVRTKNIFYEPTFHDTDWDRMYTEYQKYVPHTGNGYAFADMLSELLGELNVSHCWSNYNRSIENPDITASLGIFMDFTHKGNGIKIEEVIAGGPLDKAAFSIKPGAIITKIDGEEITTDKDVAQFLNRKVDKFVFLDIEGPGKNDSQQITVKPISQREENGLLYERWKKKNQDEVLAKSGGKLGYVHIPGMSDSRYRTVYDEMLGKYADMEGVVVDTRFNGGGDLVSDLAMFFTGEDFITYATADKVVGGEPTSRWTKPTVTLFNEANYSDGHCYAQGYTDLEIGKTIGMPVPGTCSFAGWEGLPNGSFWGVVPVSAKDKNGRWMENLETDPDYVVKNKPGVIDAGRDEQLEKAIEVLMEEVGK